jgi:hypothetical protein
MKRLVFGLAIAVAAASVLVAVAVGPAQSAGAKLSLKASTTSCTANTSVKFTATVTSGKAPYAVRLYKKVDGSWKKVATASQVSGTKYVAYATASPKGKIPFRAASVNSAGTVIAYSKIVTITVK